ncbi:amino acid adenylation domain-containing protein [Moorena sp. SIO3H5]|uniref:amino acid adenylation domain-containing protein n=1 Tax=Moorena sp. SIO3H5 TaxID=2607834 RepID=UPI0013B97184|nr:amino acid adenylation domain-containing protein [Moorena sp. SIO3H5]NEO71688.1 amino acid adenylation domain-containing protein [Moorena sp. SIO3H5]
MGKNIANLVTRHSQKSPHKCAITDGKTEITYGVWEAASNRFAGKLIEMGCQKGDRVVVLASKQTILMVGILGIFKAGCIHVPLDQKMPVNRLNKIITEIIPSVILTDQELLHLVRENVSKEVKIVLIEQLHPLITDSTVEEKDILPQIESEDIAYCIYTSGSTGDPKGVLIKHGSVIDFFEGTREFYDVDEDSRCVSFSPFHFDASVMDILFPLYQGAWLYLYSDVVLHELLFEVIKNNSVTHFAAFGSMLGLIAQTKEFHDVILKELKTILTGADVPDIKVIQKWLGKGENIKIINGYGPTEGTCACAAYIIRDRDPNRRELYPIGKPLKNAKLYLVDQHNQEIYDPEIPGELLIGGTHVMAGYWNREQENKERLVEFKGIICYKTGDICKYLADGNLFFLGRNDNEVNVGGYRINLNGIKQVINRLHWVENSEVVTIESKYGEKMLAAALMLANETSKYSALKQVKEHLNQELPQYMVPRQIVVMEKFPQLSSGKTDRKTLSSLLERELLASKAD